MTVANMKCRKHWKALIASALMVLATAFPVCVGGGYGADLNLARMNVTTVGGGVPKVASYSDILFHDGFENATTAQKPNTKTRTLNSGSARDSSGTPSVPVGSYILDSPTNNDYAYYTVTSQDIAVFNKGKFGVYIYPDSTTGNSGIMTLSIDSSNYVEFELNANRTLHLHIRGGGSDSFSITTTNAIPLDTWTFVGCSWDNTTAESTVLNIYIGSNNVDTTTTDVTGAITGTSGTLTVGDIVDGTHRTLFDQAIISNLTTRDIYAIRDVVDFN